jgi:hypothetical protein
LKKKSARSTFFYLGSIAAAFGLYNSLVINSDSSLNLNGEFANKRLDEILGRITQGRQPASEVTALTPISVKGVGLEIKKEEVKTLNAEVPKDEAPPELLPANIVENLQLKLSEIQKLDTNENQTEQVQGYLNSKDGVIENLSVTFDDGETLGLENLPLSANRFIYQHNGETYHGMFFQIETDTYMVRFTDGPFRLNQLVFKKSQKDE